MNLFAIYLGGMAPGSLIEVHDVRFAIAERIEDTFDELRRTWWGLANSLHIDCYGILTQSTDGYDISLHPQKPTHPEKLYFVNLGGYQPGDFNEAHRNVFVVATNKTDAKAIALQYATHWKQPHRDFTYEVEKATALDDILTNQQLHIHLKKAETIKPFTFKQGYWPIGS